MFGTYVGINRNDSSHYLSILLYHGRGGGKERSLETLQSQSFFLSSFNLISLLPIHKTELNRQYLLYYYLILISWSSQSQLNQTHSTLKWKTNNIKRSFQSSCARFLSNPVIGVNIFCGLRGSHWAFQNKGSSFQSQSQAHHSSSGTQLSIWTWSGKPTLSDSSGLPGGQRGRDGGVSQPSQAKPCLHTSPQTDSA